MSSRARRLYLRNGNSDNDPRNASRPRWNLGGREGGREVGSERARARRMERLWHRWPSTEAAASNGARLWWEREQRDNKLQESGSATARESGRGRERGTEGERASSPTGRKGG